MASGTIPWTREYMPKGSWNMMAYGYSAYGATQLILQVACAGFSKTSVNIKDKFSAIISGLRASSGENLVNFDLMPYLTAAVLASGGRGISFTFEKSDGFGITNAAILCGILQVTISSDITL